MEEFFYFYTSKFKQTFMKKLLLSLALLFSYIATAQFPEGFEGGSFPPSGWVILNNGIGTANSWTTIDDPNTGANAAFIEYENVDSGIAEDWLITPSFTVTADNPLLSFFQKQSFGINYGSIYTVRVSTTSQTDPSAFTIVDTQLETAFTLEYSSKIVDLTPYIGQTIFVAFVMANDDGDDWLIDDVTLTSAASLPSCASNPTPADAATNVPIGPITLSWSAPSSGTPPTSYDLFAGATPTTVTQFVGNYTETNTGTDLNVDAFGVTVYWRIVPKNASGSATGCPVWSFTTLNNPLPYCLDGELFPAETFTPTTCDGVEENVIVNNAYAGEYSNVNVTDGQTYIFKSSVATDFVTISNEAGDVAIVWGTTPLTWVSNTTGVIRFYLHTSNQCGVQQTNRIKSVVCGVPSNDVLDYYNLQFPGTASIEQGGSFIVYGQVYEAGLTDVVPNIVGQAPGITAWVGISPEGQNTNPNTWTTWIPMTWNAGAVGNNDEYEATIGSNLTAGTYYYATRYRLNQGAFVYGGYPPSGGGAWNGTTSNSGVLTVTVPPVPANDACDSAIAVTAFPYENTQNASGATNNTGFITACISGMNDGVWYTCVGNGNDLVILVDQVVAWDPEIGVYTGSCGNFTCVGTADVTFTGENETYTIANSIAGTTYYINIGNWSSITNNPEGPFRISVTSLLSNIDFQDQAGIKVYPNPVKDILQLSSVEDILDIKVYNLLGQEVLNKTLTSATSDLDVSILSAGTYLVNVTTSSGSKTIKVVKQ